MKSSISVTLVLVLALGLISGCAAPSSENTPVQQPQVVYVPDVEAPDVEESETIFGGSTTIKTGIPKHTIVDMWKNDDDFTSPAIITFFLDGEGEFEAGDSKFSFDYKFINEDLIYLRANSGKTFIDPNIEKFIAPQGQPATKTYKVVDQDTFVIGDITLKLIGP